MNAILRNAAKRVWAASIAVCLLLASPALAWDRLDFRTPGATDDLRLSLRGASLLVGLKDQGVTDPQEILAAARAEYSRLIGALYSEGYYGGVITILIDGREAASIPPLATLDRIDRVVVRIESGPNYKFSRAAVAPIAPGTDLPGDYAVGEPARTTAIRSAATAAVTGWRNAGNAKASVADQSIVANHRSRTVASDLRIDPGPRLRFGNLIIRGDSRVREARIRQIAGFPTGKVFDPEEIQKSAGRLRRSGAFRSVSLTEAETANADGTLDVILRIADERRRRYGVGLDYSTTEGLSANAFWMHRNLLGGAERLRIEGAWSSIDGSTGGMDYSLGARLTRVATRGPDTDLYISTTLEQMNEPDYTSHSVSAEIGYTRIATDKLNLGVGIGVLVSSIKDANGTQEYYFLNFPLTATWEGRDDRLNPKTGVFADLHLTPFLGLQGSESGARFFGDGRTYYTLGEARPITLAGRLQFGTIVGASLGGVPNDLRFYSGGGGTVRGQDYQSLDVKLNGVDSGGKSFLGLSGEARVAVTESIAAVGFVDWGYVGENSLPDGTGGSHAGAGVGLRYNTGIGPIRVDVAFPVAGDTNGSDYHLYIGIGQAF